MNKNKFPPILTHKYIQLSQNIKIVRTKNVLAERIYISVMQMF